jgi:hypothetical protein
MTAARSHAVLVLGSGRCGTSIVAGVLHKLGVPMGERLMPSSPSNIHGHFEDLDFHTINKQYVDHEISLRVFVECLHTLMISRAKTFDLWGLKDPRVCDVLPIYLTALQFTRVRLTVIRCVRAQEDTALSWSRAERCSLHVAEDIVRTREESLDDLLRGYEPLEMRFEEKQWAADRLAAHFDLPITEEAQRHVRI